MITAVLTAAGLSSRMGRPKPLLQWRGTTLVEHQISILFEGGASEVIVVLGHRSEDVVPYIEGTGASYVVNHRYREGRTSSTKAGLEAVPEQANDVIVMGVDQPRTVQIIRRVVEVHTGASALLTSPRLEGRGGHPLMFSARLLPELKLISEENQGLREVFERHRAEITEVHFDDPMVRLDLNTPEAYESAYQTYGQA
ncbi:MAG: nucleotidyltransferase family protein [Dehalococcoidia bacterium]|nr:nucleotidyltransferase family protein [Dehalococcoidia bacterium]